MKNLEGKVALVTGAARNIGLAIASKLASQGSRVVLADIDGGAAEKAAMTLGGLASRSALRPMWALPMQSAR